MPTTLKEAYGKVSKKYASGRTCRAFAKAMLRSMLFGFGSRKRSRAMSCRRSCPAAFPRRSGAQAPPAVRAAPAPRRSGECGQSMARSRCRSRSCRGDARDPGPNYKGSRSRAASNRSTTARSKTLSPSGCSVRPHLIPVEGRASEIGDTVIADLEGKFDDEPDADPIVANDLEIKLGDEVIEKAFTENLVGVKEDEEKEFTVAYPAEFSSEAWPERPFITRRRSNRSARRRCRSSMTSGRRASTRLRVACRSAQTTARRSRKICRSRCRRAGSQ